MDRRKVRDWINPNQWVVDLGCKIKYNADKMDELNIADLILETCEVRERDAKAAGLREAAAIAEGLNGWGRVPNPELAHHIAKVTRERAFSLDGVEVDDDLPTAEDVRGILGPASKPYKSGT